MPDLQITLDKKYHVVLEQFIHGSGRAAIARLVNQELHNQGNGVELEWRDLGGFELVNNDGKIAKRINRNLYNRTGYALPNTVVEAIGNLAREHTISGEYLWQLSPNMWVWDEEHLSLGEENEGSCFYTHRDRPRGPWALMNENPYYYCSRVFDADSGHVIARAWAAWLCLDRMWLFNNYSGVDNHIHLNHHSIIAATAIDAPVTQAIVGDSEVWVNSNRANVIGTDNYGSDETCIYILPSLQSSHEGDEWEDWV